MAKAKHMDVDKKLNAANKKIRKTGGKSFLILGQFIKRIQIRWDRMKDSLVTTAGEYADNKMQSKIDKINKEIEEWEKYSDEVASLEQPQQPRVQITQTEEQARTNPVHFQPNPKAAPVEAQQPQVSPVKVEAALSYSAERIEKLKQKKIKVSNKGLGIFTLSALALKKISKDKIDQIQKKRAENKKLREENKQKKEKDRAEAKEQKAAEKEQKEAEKAKKASEKKSTIIGLLTQILNNQTVIIANQHRIMNELKNKGLNQEEEKGKGL